MTLKRKRFNFNLDRIDGCIILSRGKNIQIENKRIKILAMQVWNYEFVNI